MELEDEADLFVAELRELRLAEHPGVLSIDIDAARRVERVALDVLLAGPVQAAEEVEQRALARAAGAHDGDVLVAADRERDAAEDVVRVVGGAEDAVDVLGAEQWGR